MSDEKRIIVVDSQILSSVQSCARKTFYNFEMKLRFREVSEVLERGDLVHTILERYYLCLKGGMSVTESIKEAVDTGRKKYSTLSLDIAAAEFIIDSFIAYARHYEYDGWQVIAVEEAFLNKIYEDNECEFYYSGKIDLLVDIPNVGLVPIDHKSRARKNDEIRLNNQFIGYATIMKSPMVIVNEFGLQTSKSISERFRRMQLPYPQGLKDQWLENTIYWCKTLDYYAQNGTWPLQINPMVCKYCSYRPLCEAENDTIRGFKIASEYYVDEKWDVTKNLEKDGRDENEK